MSIPQQAPFLDAANPLLARVPARLETGTIQSPDGMVLGVVTVRTQSTTVSPILTAAELDTWIKAMQDLAAMLRRPVVARAMPAGMNLLNGGKGVIRSPGA